MTTHTTRPLITEAIMLHSANQQSKEVRPTPCEVGATSSDAETSIRSMNDLERAKSGSIYYSSTLSLPREILFVTVVCCAQLTTQAGLGHVLGILKVIADDFGIESAGQESWLIAAYSLTVGSFILISGRLGDIFGYKKMIIFGYLWYSLWSLVCGLSIYRGAFMFTFARALQGIGPSILLPNGLAVLGASYPNGRRKHMVFSLFGACAPSGCIIGAALSAVFAEYSWWPWTFFVFSMGLLVLAALSVYAVPPNAPHIDPKTLNFRELIARTDILAGLVGVTGLVLVNVAWNQAPSDGWARPYVYILLILGAIILTIFFYLELRISEHPLLPLQALNSNVAFVLACMAFGWGCFGIWSFYVWSYISRVMGFSPLLLVAWNIPVIVAGAIAAVCTGFILGKVGPAWTMVGAMSAFFTGTALFTFRPEDQIYWAQMFICVIVMPWGMDMSFPAATIILSESVPRQHQGAAASLVNTVVNYSISIALGFAGTAEVYLSHDTKTKEGLAYGYHIALYVGLGLAGLGWLTSIIFLAKHSWDQRRERKLREATLQ